MKLVDETAAVPKDPVCGMEVAAANSLGTVHKAKTYYFCSDNRKREFEKNPAEYIGK